MTTFFTSDTHFGHKNILKFTSHPFNNVNDMNEELIRRWNEKVKKNDTIYHLGDVLFGKDSFKLLERLNGYKHLVMGNHDNYPSTEYLKYFNSIRGAVEYKGYILTHIPVHKTQEGRFRRNIHGHLHENVVMKKNDIVPEWRMLAYNRPFEIKDDFYINVCVEQWDLAPVSFEELGLTTRNKE